MAQVTVNIDGKAYRMACEEGQEQHLVDLAGRFDRYVGHLKGQFGEIGDLRLTVMAGIMVMDEMSELSRQVASLQAEVTNLRQSRDGAASHSEARELEMAAALEEMTARITALAARLSARPASAPVN
ncbi:cell division protein ZapA [Allorhizobium borbori]|uniref:Cell division protein ZapA n=1 Tax=Allorhizobium borbori TaxID=485907 RepID=A0A7W6P037_9HYPH|nr:cell division protein ZapA [Allorhizobium borbori]MBB4102038.1 cell division protein ZapA [Allorhizobium borbori]PZU20531.1 MAG: cell division protein ZapA [Shinella sp.]